jgi:hypothetical protein
MQQNRATIKISCQSSQTCARRNAIAGSGRQAAQGAKDYTERSKFRERQDDRIVLKEEVVVTTERELLERMKDAGTSQPFRYVEHPV